MCRIQCRHECVNVQPVTRFCSSPFFIFFILVIIIVILPIAVCNAMWTISEQLICSNNQPCRQLGLCPNMLHACRTHVHCVRHARWDVPETYVCLSRAVCLSHLDPTPAHKQRTAACEQQGTAVCILWTAATSHASCEAHACAQLVCHGSWLILQ